MPPLLVEGTVWPGMGPPGRGPLRPPRPACAPQKLRANREVPVLTQDRDREIETECRGPEGTGPCRRGKERAPRDLACLQHHANGLALASHLSQLRWMFTGAQPESASLLLTPDRTCFPHLTFGEDTSHTEASPSSV